MKTRFQLLLTSSAIAAAIASVAWANETKPAEAQPEKPSSASAQHAKQVEAPSAEAEAAEKISEDFAVQDYARMQRELDERQRKIQERESELKAREVALEEEIKKIEAIRTQIVGVSEAQKNARAEKVAKLVETLEAMSPKAGAALLGQIDKDLAMSVMEQISTPKLAKLMNLLDVAKGSKLTEGYAGVQRDPSSNSAKHEVPVSKGGNSEGGRR